MTKQKIKKTSFVLIVIATLLLLLNIIHFRLVDKTEKGLWDFLPGSLLLLPVVLYLITFISSYILFVYTRQLKSKFDFIPNILFLLNGFAIMMILLITFTNLMKNL